MLGFLNVYPFRYSYVADHFQYLASLGVIVPGIALLVWAIERTSTRKAVTIASSVLLILVLGVLTWRQSRMYSDEETLYRQLCSAIQTVGWPTITWERFWLPPGDTAGCDPGVLAALRIKPDYASARHDLAVVLATTPGRMQDAIAQYQAAILDNPDVAETHYDLGNLLCAFPDGDRMRSPSTRRRCESSRILRGNNNLGIQLATIPGRAADAIAEFRAALQTQPGSSRSAQFLGLMLSRMPGRLPDAIAEYQAALRAKPDYAEAHANLGNALVQTPGRFADALEEYREALQIRPDYAEAHFFLGNALSVQHTWSVSGRDC